MVLAPFAHEYLLLSTIYLNFFQNTGLHFQKAYTHSGTSSINVYTKSGDRLGAIVMTQCVYALDGGSARMSTVKSLINAHGRLQALWA